MKSQESKLRFAVEKLADGSTRLVLLNGRSHSIILSKGEVKALIKALRYTERKTERAQNKLNKCARIIANQVFYHMVEDKEICPFIFEAFLEALDEVGVPDYVLKAQKGK